jgi:Fe-S-cluster containining protein
MATKIDGQRGRQLVEMIEHWPPEVAARFQQMVRLRFEEFKTVLKTNGVEDFVKEFYEVFDDAVQQEKTLVSCSKGCHFCCRQNVHVYKSEAAVIAEYCREHDIEIPKAYLKEQMKYGWRELAQTEVGWCTFLKNGNCSIYSVRPISCRNYFVVSNPKFCDIVTYPSKDGHRVVSKVLFHPLMLGVAFGGVMQEIKDDGGTLSEMLLPYSK